MGNEHAILKAIDSREIITLLYTDKKGNRSFREVEPYEIKNGKFYGYCLTKNSIRSFDLHSISKVELTGKNYNPRWN